MKRLDLKLTRVLDLRLTGGGEEVLRVNQHRAHERNEHTANNDLQVFALGGGLRFCCLDDLFGLGIPSRSRFRDRRGPIRLRWSGAFRYGLGLGSGLVQRLRSWVLRHGR